MPQHDKGHPDWAGDGRHLPDNHPARKTADQEKYFAQVLDIMHFLYTWANSRVLVLPNVPADASNNMAYKERGWTCFELSVSSAVGNICNAEGNGVVLQVLDELDLPKASLADFEDLFGSKHFTQGGDRDKVKRMYEELQKFQERMYDVDPNYYFSNLWF